MERPVLEAKKRTTLGRKVKKLRREGILPANLYGKNVKSTSLEVPLKEFQKVYAQVGESGLVDLKVEGQVKPILVHNVQLHSVTDEPLHADLHQVSLTEKTTAMVPIELAGEAPAVEQKTGILIQTLAEVEVEALPQDLPDHLTVDISKLAEINAAVTVADIGIDKAKVEIKAEPTEVVAKIEPLVEEEVVAPPPAAEGEEAAVPAEGEEVPAEEAAEGEVAVEGKKTTEEEKEE